MSDDYRDDEVIAQLSELNHAILEIYTNYEQLVDFCEVLYENNNRVIEEEDLIYFSNIVRRLERYSSQFKLLREYVAQVRSSYQSQLDLSLNNTMKLFTIISAIFLPLTLIVGWYGMNFENMPELTWEMGYLYVIVLSIAVVIISIWLFKKNDWI